MSFRDKGPLHEKAASEEAAFLLSINQFLQNDFFRAPPDIVHPANPGHLIFRLQLFIDAFCPGHPGDDLLHSLSAVPVDLCQVLV